MERSPMVVWFSIKSQVLTNYQRTQGPGIIRYVIGIVNEMKVPFLEESDKLGSLLLWPFLAAWLSWISPRR